jgi:DNA-binding LacI/PurR family transcriptional regulator
LGRGLPLAGETELGRGGRHRRDAPVLDHLHAGGARSAAFVGSQQTNSSSEQRLSGFRRRAGELVMTVEPGAVLLGEFSIDWGEAVAALLARLTWS